MKALIILAHGSRRHESNQEIHALTDEVRLLANNHFDYVECAFLELVDPKLITVINDVVKCGVDEVVVLPYFLNSGNHVTHDIPEIIDVALENHPGCKFSITNCIGMHKDMPNLILEQTTSKL